MKNKKTKVFIGNKIRELRIAKGMTQDNLAQCIDLSRVSLINIECGRQGLTIENLLMMCALFECTPTDILPEVPKVEIFEKVKSRQVIVKKVITKKAKFTYK